MNHTDDDIPKHRSKKNTKKWCKGKEGKLHSPVWVKSTKYLNFDWLEYTCSNCNKVLDIWYYLPSYNRAKYVKPVIGSTQPLQKIED